MRFRAAEAFVELLSRRVGTPKMARFGVPFGFPLKPSRSITLRKKETLNKGYLEHCASPLMLLGAESVYARFIKPPTEREERRPFGLFWSK